ncbi:MAG: peptide ABC transporter permease [Geminicoccus sp.]|jgi:peptide/nickel transport system permease protein|nr:peptide ABC transporter permease [Geminicoccus sp.]
MLTFALRKLIILLLTLLVVSAVVFAIVGGNARALRTIAVLELGPRTPQTEQDRFIQRTIFHQCDPGTGAEVVIEAPDDPEHPNGFYIDPNKCRSLSLAQRYGTWLFGFLQGDWGESIVFKKHVAGYRGVLVDAQGNERPNPDPWGVINERLANTGMLAAWVFGVMVTLGLFIGILAGMNEGSIRDRSLSVVAIGSTSMPEYVMGILLVVLLAGNSMVFSALGSFVDFLPIADTFLGADKWARKSPLQGSANLDKDGITFANTVLPVSAVIIYGFGYIARMTRASMAEAMGSQYVRTAVLKGVPRHQVVLKHALRNALIAPFTVIMLQFPYLLSGLVVVEVIFSWKGFGFALNAGASNMDYNLILACSVVSVIVVLLTQFISDVGYVLLNPRIRVA